eukprot:GFYU01004741.1.p1 GENE.GFYU01004741.1~~GFYU01004741.1.p1  ORF type:complete len:225 (+),score=72.01 GFYU01004741.1:78-752(+)
MTAVDTFAKAFTYAMAITTFAVTVSWVQNQMDGVGKEGLHLFNWHPILMVLGTAVLGAQGIISYRVVGSSHNTRKAVHAISLTLAFASLWIGFDQVWTFHHDAKIPNFYSVHSWMGMFGLVAFSAQLLAGILVYGFGLGSDSFRSQLGEYHAYSGKAIFLLLVISCITGLLDKQWIQNLGTKDKFDIPQRYMNIISLLLAFLAFSTIFVLRGKYSKEKEGGLLG